MSQRKPMTAMALEDLPERELTAAQEEAGHTSTLIQRGEQPCIRTLTSTQP